MSRRSLIVVADDFGLTAGTSRAILDCFRSGIVTATSVLVNAPGFDASMSMLRDEPALEVGLHGALVGEDPPVCDPARIPTLVDRRGRLAGSWRALLPRLAAGRVDPCDVERELAAQLARLRSAGLRASHLNLHQHLQLWPSVRTVVVELCAREGIGYVRTPASTRSGPRGAALRRLAQHLRDELATAGVATNDAFAGLDEAGAWSTSALEREITRIPGDVVEINVHPGADQDVHRSRYRWGYQWGRERDALLRPELGDAVERAGFELTGPGQVATGRRGVG